MSQRRPLYVMGVLNTSFVRYECPKDVFHTLDVLNTSQEQLYIYWEGKEASSLMNIRYMNISLVLYIFRTEYNFKRKRNS